MTQASIHPSAAATGKSVRVWVDRVQSPLGDLITVATRDALVLLEFSDRRMVPTQMRRVESRLRCAFVDGRTPIHDRVQTQLDEYFASQRREFDVPLLVPGTPFQTLVWNELRRIPAGETRSYAEVASQVGRPDSVRAMARANGDNRVAIIIPCHRVIGSDGNLTGYGGGLWRKKNLLELEAAFGG